jgi:asparagine synthetase B (glutamine-hydrolysing)
MMPGLVGIIQLQQEPVHDTLLATMRDILRHRLWYSVEDYVSPDHHIAVSRVHLNVINREAQPYLAHAGRVQVFLHGEIYRDATVPPNPLEWIAELYEVHGQDFASYLKGSFIVLIVDQERRWVLLANDRIASRPLFYFQDETAFYFAPEMKSLLTIPSLRRTLHLPAVADFLTNGHFTADHTLLEGVCWLDNATVLCIADGQVTQQRYWQFMIQENAPNLGPDTYRENLGHILRQAVRRCLSTDARYGVLLSGGHDSKSILGSSLEVLPAQAVNTISWGREENIPHSDCVIARRLAETLGTNHQFYPLVAEEILADFRTFVWMGEGLTDFPEAYAVFDRIRSQQAVDIVLRGDQCFGDSHWTTVHDEFSMFRSLDLRVLRYMPDYRSILNPAYYQQFCELDAVTRQRLSERCAARDIFARKHFYYLNVRNKYYLNPLNCVKNFAMESFRPLLDYDLLDFVTTLPPKYRLGKRFWRATVTELFPIICAEIAKTHNMINWRSALRRAPENQQFVYGQLLAKSTLLSEFINRASLKQYLDAFYAPQVAAAPRAKTRAIHWLETSPYLYYMSHKAAYHMKRLTGKFDHSLDPEQLIMRLLILKVWGDIFLDYRG